MGTTKKPAPRRKRPATGKGKPAAKVQAPRPRKKREKKPTVQHVVLPPIPAEPRVMFGFLPNGFTMESDKPIPAEEIISRSDEVRARFNPADEADTVGGANADDTYDRNFADIALTVLVVITLIAVIAGLARSAV